jgi:hypothetical protein
VALSDEQNAMLRLLASGEQGYADIAALLGLSEDEVRAKVVGALAQLQAEGKPAPDVPPPIPGGAQPAAEVTAPEPEPVETAPPAAEEPAIADAVAPAPALPANEKPSADPSGAADPTPKPAPGRPKPPAVAVTPAVGSASPPSSGPPSGGRTITLPSGRGAWLVGGGVVAAIVVIVVVILVASGGGGGGSSSTTAAEAPANAAAEEGATKGAAEENGAEGTSKEPTEAELVAVDGGDAKGRAGFGRIKNKLALQVEATGLEATTKGTDSYWIWLAQSPKRMLPLASTEVKASGKGAGTIAAEFEVPVEVLGYLASGTFDQMTITLADNAQIKASVEAAKTEKTTPAYTGKAVLHGTITGPIVGLATREKEEEAKAE